MNTETITAMPTTLLTPLSLASISRGSPVIVLMARPTTLTTRISSARPLTPVRRTRAQTVRNAGTTLLQPSAATSLSPNPSLRR